MEQLTKDTLALHEDERKEKLKLQAQLTASEECHKESLKQPRESKDRATELEGVLASLQEECADIKKKAYNAERSRKQFESAKATLKEERDTLLLERDELARSLEEAKESALENSTAAEQVHSLQAEIKELKRNLEMQNAAAAEWKGQAANFESRYKRRSKLQTRQKHAQKGRDGSTKQTETRSLKSVLLRFKFGIAMAAVMIMLADVRTLATAVVGDQPGFLNVFNF
eukprot:g23973.t1